MDQTVNARQNADKCTELGDGNDRSLELRADGILVLELLPGVVLFLLVAQGNLLVLGVIALNIHFDGIANADDLRGMLDVVPAQFADVAQAIHAADVNKGTVGSQALDNASVLLVNFNVLPELIALCLVFFSSNLVDAADDLAACALGDNQLNVLANQLGVVLIAAHGSLRTGNKHTNALDVDNNAALVGFHDVAFHNGVVFGSLGNILHALLGFKTDTRKGVNTFLVIGLDNNQIQLVIHLNKVFHLGVGVMAHLAELDDTSVLGTINTDDTFRRGNADDLGFYDLTCVQGLCFGCSEHLLKAHVVTDFFTHTVKYLLNYRRRR